MAHDYNFKEPFDGEKNVLILPFYASASGHLQLTDCKAGPGCWMGKETVVCACPPHFLFPASDVDRQVMKGLKDGENSASALLRAHQGPSHKACDRRKEYSHGQVLAAHPKAAVKNTDLPALEGCLGELKGRGEGSLASTPLGRDSAGGNARTLR